ncbi:hypothetical protein AB4Z27_27950, partial [Cupriavidus sp. KB_39]|uniref:hypothetical protein n=1 Tax=Cupriavidus sp. KB_39 TaxID=3233036 RepID=UPI003F93C88B
GLTRTALPLAKTRTKPMIGFAKIPKPRGVAVDFLTFVTKTFEAWAWPITVLALVGWFKDELKAVLLNIETFKAGGFEATVNRKIRAASEIADNLPPSQAPSEEASSTYEEAKDNPEFAIVEAWKELEHFAKEYVELRTGTQTRARIASTSMLKQAGFTQNEADLYRELLHLRNLVVHERDVKVSAEQAKEYVDLAYRLVGLIRVRIDAEPSLPHGNPSP